MKLNQVTLPTRDIRASIEFYRAMGFELLVEDAHYARFKATAGDATFSLHAADGASATPGVVVYFECDALDEQVARLQGKGIAFTQAPRDEPWLWREARLVDPSGNVLCLYHAGVNRLDPPWRIGRSETATADATASAAQAPPRLVAIVAAEAPPRTKASNYPEPFASRMAGRLKRPLGDLFGLANFGVNLTRLEPGAVSALRHAHSKQDEFVYILQGHPTLHTDESRRRLAPGMCAGFAAGTGNAHRLLNESAEPVVYLEVGDRSAGDEGSYPDDDLEALRVEGAWAFVHKDGTPY